jgi:hypothetical protein
MTNPVHIYNTWFDHYGLDNPIVDRRDQMASKLTLMLVTCCAAQRWFRKGCLLKLGLP